MLPDYPHIPAAGSIEMGACVQAHMALFKLLIVLLQLGTRSGPGAVYTTGLTLYTVLQSTQRPFSRFGR